MPAGLLEAATFRAGFNTSAVVLGATLLGVAAGVTGVFALLRRRSLMADALAHATLPGIVLAFLFAPALGLPPRSMPWLLAGGAASGVVGVLAVNAILRATRLREDAAIGIVLSVFFGIGVVGLSYIQANASTGAAGLNTLIYGQTAAMRPSDAALMGALALGAIVLALGFHKELASLCFNDAFARASGSPVGLLDLGVMGVVVMVTIAGLQAVGLLLVVALLVIPAASARFWTDRLWRLAAISGAFGGVSGYAGAIASATLPQAPAGALIVLSAGSVFLVSMLAAPRRGVVARAASRLATRLRIERDHVLERAHLDDAGTLSVDRIARERGWSAEFAVLARWSLRRAGYAAGPAGAMRPTPAGLERGRRVARNHALWERYLVTHADVAATHVDWSVDQVEHVLSEELVAQLERQLEPTRAGTP